MSAAVSIIREVAATFQQTHYALKNADDQWVHHSLTRHYKGGPWRMTEVKAWRWSPTRDQLEAAIEKHPSLAEFTRVRIPVLGTPTDL